MSELIRQDCLGPVSRSEILPVRHLTRNRVRMQMGKSYTASISQSTFDPGSLRAVWGQSFTIRLLKKSF